MSQYQRFRNKQISIRLTEDEADEVKKASLVSGLPVNKLVLLLARSYLDGVTEAQETDTHNE